MPTGYTAAVADGSITDLQALAMQFARGMGALIMMRDEPHDAPIPDAFEPQTDYHDRELVTARARLAELEAMDLAARAAACAAYNAKVEADNATEVAKTTEVRNRYNSMIAKVVKWNGAPEGIKEFMLEQLRSGRDFDCPDNPTEYMPKTMSVADWYREELRKASWGIGYHEGERAKEIARTAERNAWLKQLRQSLGSPSLHTGMEGGGV